MVSIGDECGGWGWTYCSESCVVVFGVDMGSISGGVGEVGIADVALVLGRSWLSGVRGVGS